MEGDEPPVVVPLSLRVEEMGVGSSIAGRDSSTASHGRVGGTVRGEQQAVGWLLIARVGGAPGAGSGSSRPADRGPRQGPPKISLSGSTRRFSA